MSGLRFKVGELAIVLLPMGGKVPQGSACEVVEIQHFDAGTECGDGSLLPFSTDYIIDANRDGFRTAVADWQLKKIDPPAEPTSLTRESESEVVA